MSQAPLSSAPSPKQLETIASLFKVLGEPMRLRILQAVCHGPRHVGDIVASTGATQPNVSKHLALLVQAKVVERNREGQRVIYALRDPLVMRLCEMVCASLG
jgi:DNA-binding transcriptional ArsR family regulator